MATGVAELPRLALRRLGRDAEGSRVLRGRRGGGGKAVGITRRSGAGLGFGRLELGPEERERKGMLGKGGRQGPGDPCASDPSSASVSLPVRWRPFGERTGRRRTLAALGLFEDGKTDLGGVADASFFNTRSGGVAKNK